MDYREFIENELSRRVGRNSSYSLRSFARDLGISPGRLSLVLNGKSGLSREMAKKIGQKLGLDEIQCSSFCDGVAARHARSSRDRAIAAARLKAKGPPKFHKLPEEHFRVIADWFHLALLELVSSSGFRADSQWIAGRLGISALQAKSAWRRLVRLGLVKKNGNSWGAGDHSLIQRGNSLAVRSYHHQMLDKAKRAIDSHCVEERDLSSVIFQFPLDRMEEMRNDIKDFRRHLMQKYQDRNNPEIYALQIQFHRITERKK